jgi:hypothetical protein
VYLCSNCRRTTFNFPSFNLVKGVHSPTGQHHRERERAREREREREGEGGDTEKERK